MFMQNWRCYTLHKNALSDMRINLISSRRFIRYCCLGLVFLCASQYVYSQAIITALGSPFSMFNGSDLSAWKRHGDRNGNASWQVVDNEIQVSQGHGLLVSRLSVPNFEIEFDYFVSEQTQASVYFRCTNPSYINTETAYEVSLVNGSNGVGAGSIMLLSNAKPTMIQNQWNHIKISAIDTELSVTLNGVTNQVRDTRFSTGPIAINFLSGELRLKKIYVTIPGRW